MMLTIVIRYKGTVVYLRPFKDHKEAIDHFSELFGSVCNEAWLELTNETVIPMGVTRKKLFYVG